MGAVSAVALFCEDVRRERIGRTTLIGIMPDVLSIPTFPYEIARLTVYFRIKFDSDGDYKEAILPNIEWGDVTTESRELVEPMPLDMIQRAVARGRGRNIPFVTLTGRIVFNEPLIIKKPGQMLAFLNIGTEKVLCGALSFIASDRSTASEPRSGQSAPDAPQS